MNNKNSNNSQKVLKVSKFTEIPKNYTGIIEWSDGDKEWYLNGKWHRTDGPAVERADGDKHWFLNGKYHRIDGPAVEYFNGSKVWCLNGKRHRTDGPAIEGADGSKAWYLNGIRANPLFFEISGCEKYVDYYMTILQTELKEHEEFLLKELKKQVELEIKSNQNS